MLYTAIVMTVGALCVWIYQDWPFLRKGRRRGIGFVVGHERVTHEGDDSFRAIVAWRDDEGVERKFVDAALNHAPEPPIGGAFDIEFPAGRADLARIRRPAIRIAVYLILVALLALLTANVLGFASLGESWPAGL